MGAEAGDLTGATVELHGLKKRADINGQHGRVVSAATDGSGRWLVELADGEIVRLKPDNVNVVEDAEQAGDAEEDMESEEGEEVEEGEEGEEDDEDESEEEGGAEATVPVRYPKGSGKLGVNFESDKDLTVVSVSPDTPCDKAGIAQFVGWKLSAINGTAVHTITDASKAIVKMHPALKLTFIKGPPKYVDLEELLKAEQGKQVPGITADKISFLIPAAAPLYPGARIEFALKRSKSSPPVLAYKVNGSGRPPVTQAAFSLLGDYYTRELRFPSLGTCMWLPAEHFAAYYSALLGMFEQAAVETRGFHKRFKEETLSQVLDLEKEKEEERLEKEQHKQLKGMNVKKRKVVMRQVQAKKRARGAPPGASS